MIDERLCNYRLRPWGHGVDRKPPRYCSQPAAPHRAYCVKHLGSEPEFAPCPRCGNARDFVWVDDGDDDGPAALACGRCGASTGTCATHAEAAQRWAELSA